MRGRVLILGFLGGLACFVAALWYFQTYAFYEDLPRQDIRLGGQDYPVVEWQGTYATSSPLKLRACFTVSPETLAAMSAVETDAAAAEPLVAPSWFDCFDAGAIAADLKAGKATAFALGPTGADGIDGWMALYPDGRGYLWRQLHPRFANQ